MQVLLIKIEKIQKYENATDDYGSQRLNQELN